MTKETSALLFKTALNVNFFPLEDVFMTGIVTNISGVTVQNIPNFLIDKYERMGPSMAKEWVALHSVNTSNMYRMWNEQFEMNLITD